MTDVFSSIGVPPPGDEEELEALVRMACGKGVEDGHIHRFSDGAYVVWRQETGAELWIQIDAAGDLVGMNPHFSGTATMTVELAARVTRPDEAPMDGALLAWMNPSLDDEEAAPPVVFDCPDFRLNDEQPLPARRSVALSAFPMDTVKVFENAAAFHESQTGEVAFAADFFIPVGVFTPQGEAIDPPNSHALFAGEVVAGALLTNAQTGLSFHWAWIRTLGGDLEMVAPPNGIDGPLVPGAVVQGPFWLSGRLV